MENLDETDSPVEITPPASPPPETIPDQALSWRAWLARNGPALLFLIAVVIIIKIFFSLLVVGMVAAGLGLVIFIHELGHFLVAKWCDVHVETFSIGFGPALPGCSYRWGETTYMLALFPLGGYVKMVGEGPESEENEDDPRSFKNKPVWQRMAIISAGVTMNILLGGVLFVIAFLHGIKQSPGVIGTVDVGSASWDKGIHTGGIIERIGSADKPYFEDVKPEVMLSWKGEKLPFDYLLPDGAEVKTTIEPRRSEFSTHPVIGVVPPPELRLYPPETAKERALPVLYTSAAAQAKPAFGFGDRIIGTTDPDKPGQVKELPWDPREPNPHSRDYFEFQKRMQLLAGKPVTIRVQRDAAPGAQPVVEDIQVPPAYHYTFGMRMRMGKITAVRENSPAQKAGVKTGDVLKKVEVTDSQGKVLALEGEKEDPFRLPDELEKWAAEKTGDKLVTLTVLKPNEAEATRLEPVAWDDAWRFDHEVPASNWSPLAIRGLGMGYQVETTVVEVEKGSPAEEAKLQKDDVLTDIRIKVPGKTLGEEGTWGPWTKLWTGEEGKWSWLTKLWSKKDSDKIFQPWWANVFWLYQNSADLKEIQVKVRRGKEELPEPVTLKGLEDNDWPLVDRGFLFTPDWRIQKAATFGEAVGMGWHKTVNFIKQVYGQLVSIFTGRLSPETLGGPIRIAQFAYIIAAEDFYWFLLFLGIISVNLAVINFLPIPLLDGGHMVFLVYEKLRGKPASEQVRAAATYVGLALILCLMVFVIYIDVKHLF